MKTVILAGGLGTRISEDTPLPKRVMAIAIVYSNCKREV